MYIAYSAVATKTGGNDFIYLRICSIAQKSAPAGFYRPSARVDGRNIRIAVSILPEEPVGVDQRTGAYFRCPVISIVSLRITGVDDLSHADYGIRLRFMAISGL
ncbi:hypothetical protein [Arthrobacter sp. CJ23]|uniref:hypothetical protein n=1 Tax=Arthrobacter sp. CJ23 TaxID=2972479 RepID=UPI00215BCF1D|nr:hypothetical protein [Arthrobacter sp. CJ23]UVJ37778.1 hypothetical protein NVV90_10815 [Arthrobacter sp. CJ23]